MTHLIIHRCGPLTSIQDRGRYGWHRFGIPASGAADPLALAAANMLVGNPPDTAGIELVMQGLNIEVVGGPARLALAGARMSLSLDGEFVGDHSAFLLQPGRRLEIGMARTGVYALLAVDGGLQIPAALGSRSLHARSRIGGLGGKHLADGDHLPLVLGRPQSDATSAIDPLPITPFTALRTVLGPQDSYVTSDALTTFFSSDYAVTNEVDRMGCRLLGPPVSLAKGYNIVSDGIVGGSVQIPGSGQPIVMLADRQTTGGYPKIATVITPDLRLLMQRRPGELVRFRTVSVDEARTAAIAAAADLTRLRRSMRPARRAIERSEILLSLNLAGDALNALDPLTWPAARMPLARR